MHERSYGCKDMVFDLAKWPLIDEKIMPYCFRIVFEWLFQDRRRPGRKKGGCRRRWEGEQYHGPSPREQTRWPETRISPCSLRPRREEDNISDLNLDASTGLEGSILNRLPLEIRQEIYGFVLGRQENCLILLPFKIRAVPEGRSITNAGVRCDAANGGFITGGEERFWPQRPALLRTCRQVYIEAVGLLYTGNTFVIEHPELLIRFSKAIPAQRLNSIRSLRVSLRPWHYGSMSYWTSDLPRRQEWETLWSKIAAMENLLSLDVEITYEIYSYSWAEEQNTCQILLPSLLQIRGLHAFRLDVRVRHAMGPTQSCSEEVSRTREIKALIQNIEDSVKLPRKEPHPDLDKECSPSNSQDCVYTAE